LSGLFLWSNQLKKNLEQKKTPDHQLVESSVLYRILTLCAKDVVASLAKLKTENGNQDERAGASAKKSNGK